MPPKPMPPEVEASLAGEPYDFFVKAHKKEPAFAAAKSLFGGSIFIAVSLIFFFSMLFPVIQGKEVHFTLNDVPTTATRENWKPLTFPAIFILIFFVIGFGILGNSLIALTKEGPWVIGTKKRLILRYARTTRSINWEQFSGEIEVRGNQDNGTIALSLRTGEMHRMKGISRFVPEKIYIAGVKDVYGIERVIRERIQENDPTPSNIFGPTNQGIV
jgi:hypothetical protein